MTSESGGAAPVPGGTVPVPATCRGESLLTAPRGARRARAAASPSARAAPMSARPVGTVVRWEARA